MLGLPVAVDAFLLPESTCARLWVMNNISETLKSRKIMSLFKKVPPEATYEDLTQQPDPEHVLDDITQQPFAEELGDELVQPEDDMSGLPPELIQMDKNPGWHDDGCGNPVLVSSRAWAFRTPEPRFEAHRLPYRTTWAYVKGSWECVEREEQWINLTDPHALIPGGPVPLLITIFRGRTRKDMSLDDVPHAIKKRRENQVHSVQTNENKSKTKLRRMMEKEIPFEKIPPHDTRTVPGC